MPVIEASMDLDVFKDLQEFTNSDSESRSEFNDRSKEEIKE